MAVAREIRLVAMAENRTWPTSEVKLVLGYVAGVGSLDRIEFLVSLAGHPVQGYGSRERDRERDFTS